MLAKGSFTYSNTGYVVVGALLEQALDRDFELSLRERFSTVTSDPLATPDPACGHLREGKGWRAIAMQDDLDFMPGDAAWLRPAGGVIASAIELAQSASSFAVLIGEPSETLPESLWRRPLVAEEYGLGIRTWTGNHGQRVYAHSGASGHFSAELVWLPNADLAIALVANAAFDTKPILAAIDELIDEVD